MFDRYHLSKPFRYSRWDGTQQIDELDAEGILDALSEDYLRSGDLRYSLEKMMREGFKGMDGMQRLGLDDLRQRLQRLRDLQMQRHNLASVMDDIKEKLEHIKQLEREGIQRRLDKQSGKEPTESQQGQQGEQGQQGQQGQQGEQGQQGGDELSSDDLRRMLDNIAKRKFQFLDQLPEDVGGQIRELSDYDFMDDQARQEFKELQEMLQQQVMQQYFQGMTQAIQSMTPEDLSRMREMVRELNQMIQQRARGEEPDFDSFMQKYGDFFGPGINTLDDLIQQMLQRQAQMQAVMDSMTPEQREQLRGMIDDLIGDDRLRVDLAELAMNLEAMAPGGQRTRFKLTGDEPLSLTEAMALMGTLQELETLDKQLHQISGIDDLEAINADKMRELVGDEEAQALEQIQAMIKQLEDANMIRRDGNKVELTSRGMRRIGQKALQDVFAQLQRDAFGRHRLPERGFGGERDEQTKPYTFGDPFELDLERTVMNAINREGAGTPVRLAKDDFEVYHTEHMTRSSTVLLLDMSWSMLMNDLWPSAKKVAIALESLIRGQYPRDTLHLVGFANVAREYKPDELLSIGEWNHVQGTNMVHGLAMARNLLAKSRGANKQIIMITDGGPTVWRARGQWNFNWPPPPEALMQTLLEARRCARDNITINVFMLWDDPYLKRFVNEMATVNRGRAFYTNPDNLAEYVMIDYLGSKHKRVR